MSYQSNITASVLQYLDQNIDSDNVTNGEIGSEDQVDIVEAWWRRTFPDNFGQCLSFRPYVNTKTTVTTRPQYIYMFKSS